MEYILLLTCLLIVCAIREAELLRMAPPRLRRIRLGYYALSLASAVAFLSTLENGATLLQYLDHVRQPGTMKLLVAIQLGIWFYYAWLQRSGADAQIWTVALVPNPVLVVSLVGLAVSIQESSSTTSYYSVAGLIVTAWVVLIGAWTRWTEVASSEDPAWRSAFVGISNSAVVVLLPLENVVSGVNSLVRLLLGRY